MLARQTERCLPGDPRENAKAFYNRDEDDDISGGEITDDDETEDSEVETQTAG